MSDLNMTIEQVFTEIVSGRLDTSDFEQWMYYQRSDAFDDGYQTAKAYVYNAKLDDEEVSAIVDRNFYMYGETSPEDVRVAVIQTQRSLISKLANI